MPDVRPNLVSTIIPFHDRERMLEDAIASVLSQTYLDTEVILVDDGSSERAAAMARALAEENHDKVRLFRQANAGPGAARNLGLSHARGEFIQYLDSDDLLEPRKFEAQVAALRACPEAGLAFGITRRLDTTTGLSRVWARTAERIDDIFPSFLMGRGWDTNAPLWRRSTCELVGPWLELRCHEDWEHDLRAGMLGVRAVHVPEPGAIVRDHGEQRASGMGSDFTQGVVRDMAKAHLAAWARMRDLGLQDWSYLESFSRKLFWLARLCGGHGLSTEADALLSAAQLARSGQGGVSLKMYRLATGVFGWPRAVRWSEWVRKQVAGEKTAGLT
ncbi:glycosyltransferase family 2 protein [Arenimonas sp.]|uniref:glycosyltransferase family 2 protein n=1 Tax=Arenimonas sp. TaxID=1872635 RepID=UPI0039E66A21